MQILILLIVLCCCSTPKTAYNVARKRCDLEIKETYKVLDYTEEYSFNGEGVVNIIFQLNNKDLEDLAESCKKKKYKAVTLKNLIDDEFIDDNSIYGINLYNRDIRRIANGEGYYKLKSKDLKKLDFSITVLDITNKELIIYVNIP